MTPREQAFLEGATPPVILEELQRLRYENARQREFLQPAALEALAAEDAAMRRLDARAEWRERHGFSERAERLRARWARVDADRFERIAAGMRPTQRRGATRILRDGTDPAPRAPVRPTGPPAALPPPFVGSFPPFPYVTRKDEIRDERTRYAEPATPRDPFEGDITTAWRVLCWFYESYKRRSAALGAPVAGGYTDCARELGIPDPAWVRSTVLLRNRFADELIQRMQGDSARFPAWFIANLVSNRDRYRAEGRRIRVRGQGEGRSGRKNFEDCRPKLTADQAIEIYALRDSGELPHVVAARFVGRDDKVISERTVREIWTGRTWSSTTGAGVSP